MWQHNFIATAYEQSGETGAAADATSGAGAGLPEKPKRQPVVKGSRRFASGVMPQDTGYCAGQQHRERKGLRARSA